MVVKNLWNREPAVIVGFVISVLTAVQAAATSQPLTWKIVIGIVTGAIVRQFVTPSTTDAGV